MPAVRGTIPCRQDDGGACNAGVPPARNEASDGDGYNYMPALRGCLEELRHGFGELRMAFVSEVNAVIGRAGGEEHAS